MDIPGKFELDVLGYVADDYEAPHTIRAELERDLGRVITEEEIFSALSNLAYAGLVDAFTYNVSTNTYVQITLGNSAAANEILFLSNPSGVAMYMQSHD